LYLGVVPLELFQPLKLIAQRYLRAVLMRPSRRSEWAHLDSNQGPGGYEPPALTAELWAQPSNRLP
jgi:hypothetical protein